MNVTLLKDTPNPYTEAVYSSKSIGEPPMSLAVSAFQAIKMALRSARKDAGLPSRFQFESPAAMEKILNASYLSEALGHKVEKLELSLMFCPI